MANSAVRKKKPIRRKPRKVKLKPADLKPRDLAEAPLDGELKELAAQVERDGGAVIAAYREPLGGNTQLFVSLPIEKVEPTPFQRDVSDGHVRKLTVAMDKTRRYLDPVILVRSEGKYMTPNGNHRLNACQELGARSILGLLIPDARAAYQILAMNIEKAHNLREKAQEVARMYDELARLDARTPEAQYALEFEEPQLITLGFAYAERGRLSGGAYQPAIKKVDGFLKKPLEEAIEERKRRAAKLLELDDAVTEAVAKLKARGMVSPYLKAFVVARVNPLRFIKGDLPSFDELLETMTRRARGMKVEKIRTEDLSRSGGVPDEE